MKNENGQYLFVHFTGESEKGEQVYFALSEDGLHWKDLNAGKPVLCSGIGEKGVRDPFILRSRLDGNFYIIATDLRIASGKGWDVAQHGGSTKMVIWKSEDLIRWSDPWMVDMEVPGAGCVWAPEAIYDPKEQSYLVFWASCVKEEKDSEPKQRIYCAHTKDFVTFEKPRKYIERRHHVIDTTIVEENGIFYRFSKDETTKNIRMDKGRELLGEFTEVHSGCLDELLGVEGPTAFWMPGEQKWCLMVDQFAAGLGYLPLLCSDLESGDFRILNAAEYDMDRNTKRHGSVLALTREEYERVERAFVPASYEGKNEGSKNWR